MGTWGYAPFENDIALAWLADLQNSNDLSVLELTLNEVTNADPTYLEARSCECAIAAAEVIAAMLGRPLPYLPAEASTWIARYRRLDAASLLSSVRAAVARIRSHSELKDLWDDVKEGPKWYATLDDLSARLSA